jgi:hypothetical protein
MFTPFIITTCKLLIHMSLQTNIDLETMHVGYSHFKIMLEIDVCKGM